MRVNTSTEPPHKVYLLPGFDKDLVGQINSFHAFVDLTSGLTTLHHAQRIIAYVYGPLIMGSVYRLCTILEVAH